MLTGSTFTDEANAMVLPTYDPRNMI